MSYYTITIRTDSDPEHDEDTARRAAADVMAAFDDGVNGVDVTLRHVRTNAVVDAYDNRETLDA